MLNLRGVVFDFDGVLADTIEAHNAARIEAFRALGFTTDILLHAEAHRHGSHAHDIIGWALKQSGAIPDTADVSSDPTVQRVVDKKNEIYWLHAAQGLEPVSSALELVAQCVKDYGGTGLAIATTASYENEVLPYLNRHGLTDVFKVVIGKELTPAGRAKPDPYVYTLAAERLMTDPANLAAVEDSPLGVASAKSAGLFVIGVATTHAVADIHEADAVVQQLAEVSRKLMPAAV